MGSLIARSPRWMRQVLMMTPLSGQQMLLSSSLINQSSFTMTSGEHQVLEQEVGSTTQTLVPQLNASFSSGCTEEVGLEFRCFKPIGSVPSLQPMTWSLFSLKEMSMDKPTAGRVNIQATLTLMPGQKTVSNKRQSWKWSIDWKSLQAMGWKTFQRIPGVCHSAG